MDNDELKKKRLELIALAAISSSRRLSHLSTVKYVDGLNFRVQNVTGCFPIAMTAKADNT